MSARAAALRTALACLAVLALPTPASAQACTAQATTSGTSVTAGLCMNIQDVLVMRITNTLTGPATLTSAQFSSSTATPAQSTYVPYGGKVTLEVSANRTFEVTVVGSFNGPGAKAATDALWSTTQNVFTNTARNVAASTAAANRTIPFATTQPANAAWVQDVFFASRWVYQTDKTGTYPLNLTFTLTAK